jgi:hypothetical protein
MDRITGSLLDLSRGDDPTPVLVGTQSPTAAAVHAATALARRWQRPASRTDRFRFRLAGGVYVPEALAADMDERERRSRLLLPSNLECSSRVLSVTSAVSLTP